MRPSDGLDAIANLDDNDASGYKAFPSHSLETLAKEKRDSRSIVDARSAE